MTTSDTLTESSGAPRTGGGTGAHFTAGRRSSRSARGAEILGVLAAPLACFVVLRLRAMANPELPDPVIESAYVWDPRDIVVRYAPQVFTRSRRLYVGPPSAYLRWGTRPGFLVPARLAYLAFGAVPGFFVFRYVLALVAIVPAYVLGKRVWGRWAGVLAVVLIMSSPVIVTAWGTDFVDSAAVSYVLGGTACLFLPHRSRRERWVLLVVAGTLFTAAIWALATTVLIVAVVVVAWFGHRALQDRPGLPGHVAVLAGTAAVATLLTALASWAVLGQFDFVLRTIRSSLYLGTPGQEAIWHSASAAWAPYDPYLLVLPAVVVAWAVVAVVRSEARRGTALLIGLAAAGQLVVCAYLQFLGGVQVLEMHFLSSPLWGLTLLTLLVVIAEVARPLAGRPILRYLPAAAVVAVALLSEVHRTPALTWAPWGFALGGLAIAGVAAILLLQRGSVPAIARIVAPLSVAACVGIVGTLMVLTVAPAVAHKKLPHTVSDPPTGYDEALGGPSAKFVDYYRIENEARRWAPNATYRKEQLVTCVTSPGAGLESFVTALFHAGDNLLPGTCPHMAPSAVKMVVFRKAAQILVVTRHPVPTHELLASLSPLGAVLARHTRLRAGGLTCWLWLIEIPRYLSAHAV